MPRRVYVHAPLRTVLIGNRTHRVRLLKRTQLAPTAGRTDAAQKFEEVERLWADVRTKNGVFFFAGVEVGDIPVTHELYVAFHPLIDGSSWIELDNGSRLRVLRVDDLEERHLSMRLVCTERGPESKKAAQA